MKATKESISKGIWEISKVSDREIMITDGFTCAYGYISADKKTMYYDRIIFPLYVHKAALKFASKNISSIYN